MVVHHANLLQTVDKLAVLREGRLEVFGPRIAEILVDDGDEVKAGDPLVVLEQTQARAAFQVLEGNRRLLASKLARLLAEQAGRDEVTFPDWLLEAEKTDPAVQEILAAQRDLFIARREVHQGRRES